MLNTTVPQSEYLDEFSTENSVSDEEAMAMLRHTRQLFDCDSSVSGRDVSFSRHFPHFPQGHQTLFGLDCEELK